jgi:hypothetical protein
MAKIENVFYYYEQFGEICVGKTSVDDGVWVGGIPEGLARSIPVPDNEFSLTLDQLRKLYPYG